LLKMKRFLHRKKDDIKSQRNRVKLPMDIIAADQLQLILEYNNTVLYDSQPKTLSLIEAGAIKAVRVDNFLPVDERNALFEAVCREQEAFRTLGHSTTMHYTLNSPQSGNDGAGPLRKAHKLFTQRVKEHIPQILEALDLPSFRVRDIPLNLINGLDGHEGVPHMDSVVDGKCQISILYYFHKLPKVFRGGGLEFYAAHNMTSQGHFEKPACSIDIEDNLLVVFPSQTFHGITKVESSSNNFTDGRFVMVGFVAG